MKFNTPFEKYIDPSEQLPDQVIIEPGVIAHDVLPQTSRRALQYDA